MSENYYFIETIRSRNGYQWSNNKIRPIQSITPEGEYYNEEQVIELTGFAFHDYYSCYQPFYDLITKLKTKNEIRNQK